MTIARVSTPASRLLTGFAVLVAIAAAVRLIAWGNRWYVAEMFARSAGAPDGADWQFVYERIHVAHQTLVSAVVLVAIAVILLFAGRALRFTR